MVNIENDSEGPYMQDFFGDVSTFCMCLCVRKYRKKNQSKRWGSVEKGLVGPVFFGFHY